MRNLADTVARLSLKTPLGGVPPSRLKSVSIRGANPGALVGWRHVPAKVVGSPALVLVLHGCTQSAAGYDAGSGWSDLADRQGFVVLYAEQQRANNPNLCFNWFSPDDTARGRGEAASIRALVAETVDDCGIDPARIYVTGLSAGGAMTSTMLATYPEVFSGGAIIAGLPHATARTMPEAFDRMRGHGLVSEAASTAAVLTASGHAGPWPRISVWHGTADTTVAPASADAIVGQWRGVHDLGEAPHEEAVSGPVSHRLWRNAQGDVVLEDYRVAGMGHGVPLSTHGPDGLGRSGPFMLDVGVSSTRLIAMRWGLMNASSGEGMDTEPRLDGPLVVTDQGQTIRAAPHKASGVQGVIEDALRAAGLMR